MSLSYTSSSFFPDFLIFLFYSLVAIVYLLNQLAQSAKKKKKHPKELSKSSYAPNFYFTTNTIEDEGLQKWRGIMTGSGSYTPLFAMALDL